MGEKEEERGEIVIINKKPKRKTIKTKKTEKKNETSIIGTRGRKVGGESWGKRGKGGFSKKFNFY